MRSSYLLLLVLQFMTVWGFTQRDWTVTLSLRKEIGNLSTVERRIDFIVTPEVQIERVISRGSLVTKLVAMSALQRFRAEDSHFFWEYTNLAEDYDLTNWITSIGVLSSTRPHLRFQVLGGVRVLYGIPVHWNYQMDNLNVEGIDIITGRPVDPQNYPSRIIIRNGLFPLTGWQVSMGAQYEIASRLFVRSLFSFGNSRQRVSSDGLSLIASPQVKITGIGNSLTLGLAYEW